MVERSCSCNVNRRSVTKSFLVYGLSTLAPPVTKAWARATRATPRGDDERFMRLALAEAALGDFPFGAIIGKRGVVLAKGHNSGKTANDPTAHGEIMAIRNFVAERPAEELKDATIYTTGEPCPMCMAAIIWSGLTRVVFAASIEELSNSAWSDHDQKRRHRRRCAIRASRNYGRSFIEGSYGAFPSLRSAAATSPHKYWEGLHPAQTILLWVTPQITVNNLARNAWRPNCQLIAR